MRITLRAFLTICLSLVAAIGFAQTDQGKPTKANPMKLWYDAPAKKWTEALPVGNGRLGAMVFGGVEQEQLQFNDDTLWTGGPHDYSHEGAAKYLPEVRRLLAEGKQREAEKLAGEKMMSVPLRQMAYQPFGDLRLQFPGHAEATDYRRELDIDSAIATVTYRVGDTTYKREVFSSAVDQAIVVRLTADKPGKISFTALMDSPHPDTTLEKIGDGQLALTGALKPFVNKRTKTQINSVMKFQARLSVRAWGGETSTTAAGVEVKNASGASLVLVGATNHKNFRDVTADPTARCEAALAKIGRKRSSQMRKDHVADYQNLFRRLSIDLGTSGAINKPTDKRIADFAQGGDPQLVALFYQYGRYLLISSSRPGSQPANLQGLWNDKVAPAWDSKYTVNINTEMNYWPAEVTNLSECHEPLFDMLDEAAIAGAKVARVHYDADGWVVHHNLDIWRGAAPINASNHGIWMTGGAWLSQHLWLRYAYTQDKEFLAKRAYPLLKGASEFFVDFLVKDPKSGWLISTPSNSPENGGLVAGPTMDHQIIRNLFANTIEASRVLGLDADFRQKLIAMRKQIAPNQIGKHGQLQEWLEDKDNPKNKHRHISHAWGLYPGIEITPRGTPDLADAMRVTFAHRGDMGTGWSLAWKINFWARLLDGEHAYKIVSMQLTPKRTYPNMFDAHPPFQIDGNFGATSGVSEMLLQSHTGEIELLPALPKAFAAGEIRGLCARGGFEVDLAWSDGKLTKVTLYSKLGGATKVRYGGRVVSLQFIANEFRDMTGLF